MGQHQVWRFGWFLLQWQQQAQAPGSAQTSVHSHAHPARTCPCKPRVPVSRAWPSVPLCTGKRNVWTKGVDAAGRDPWLWDPWRKALPLRALNSIVSKPASGTSWAETVAANKPQFRMQNEGVGKFLTLSPTCRSWTEPTWPCHHVLHLVPAFTIVPPAPPPQGQSKHCTGFSYIHKPRGCRKEPFRVRNRGWLLASVSICPKNCWQRGKAFASHALNNAEQEKSHWMTSLHGEISGAFTFPSLKQSVFEVSGIPKMMLLLSIPEAVLELQSFPVPTGVFWLLPTILVRLEPCRTGFLFHLGLSWTGNSHSVTCCCLETIAVQREGKIASGEPFCPDYCLCFISCTVLNPLASFVSEMSCIVLQSKLPGIDKLPKFTKKHKPPAYTNLLFL